jgi:hypothetical protein
MVLTTGEPGGIAFDTSFGRSDDDRQRLWAIPGFAGALLAPGNTAATGRFSGFQRVIGLDATLLQ